MTRRCWVAVAVGISVAAFVVIECAPAWLPIVARWLDVGVDLSRADVVFALAGDDERRPFVAAALVNVGLAKQVIVVENAPSPDVVDGVVPASHRVAGRIFQSRGLRPDQILLLAGDSTSTVDEVDQLKRYLEEHPVQRACVVTNAYHTRRSRWTLRNRLAEQFERVSVVSAPNPGFDCDNWWQTPSALEAVISEYVKLGWYFLCYGHGVTAVVAGLAIGIVSPRCYRVVVAFFHRRARGVN